MDITANPVGFEINAQSCDHRIHPRLAMAARVNVDERLQQSEHLCLRTIEPLEHLLFTFGQRVDHC